MKSLSFTIYFLGGTIIYPDTGIQGHHAEIRNLGLVISMITEKCLVLTSYASMYQKRTSRQVNTTIMNKVIITSLDPLRDQEKTYVNSPPLPCSTSQPKTC